MRSPRCLNDLEAEERWTDPLARSQDKVAQLAREARSEFEQGKTRVIEDDSDLSHDC